jgi:hypothetical protein
VEQFLHKYRDLVIGALSGFDRLVIRGSLRRLCYVEGMLTYLSVAGVLLRDFGKHVEVMSRRLKQASLAVVLQAGRPTPFLDSPTPRKDLIAKAIAERDGITHGPVCTLRCVEPCLSYAIYKNSDIGRLELRPRLRKCTHLYHYFIHPVFGFMHARIQTWFPFSIQICLNGREWLARQMDQAGLGYQRQGNAFVSLADHSQAQALMDSQVRANWPALLDPIADRLNPAHAQMFGDFCARYYWTVHQSEWASDILFKSPGALAGIYPQLVQHGIRTFRSPDVLRFLGKHVPTHGNVPRGYTGEVVSDLKDRPEGVRIKHRLGKNSVKLYDKRGRILRAECTINDPHPFRSYRAPETKPHASPRWLPMRKGVADMARRADVSQKATERYLQAQAAVDGSQPLGTLTEPLCQHTTYRGQRVRGLNPLRKDDRELLSAISAAEFCIHGMRNRDLRQRLYGTTTDKALDRRRSGAVSRKFRLLRAHGLIRKVPKSHRYVVTTKGRTALTALIAARDASTAALTQMAA